MSQAIAPVENSAQSGLIQEEKAFCEFFAGIGLVRAGLESSGWKCVYANDNDPKKKHLYTARFGEESHFHTEDVRQTGEVLSRITGRPFLATASFPCIDLSLAGHWRGFAGEHSSTFFAFADALEGLDARKPKLVMIENVTGLITSHQGRDFTSLTETMAELGYWLDAFVIDARMFVPQSRPRVFVVGVHCDVHTDRITKSTQRLLGDRWSEIMDRSPRVRPLKLVQLMKSTSLKTGWAATEISLPKEPIGRPLSQLIDCDDSQEWWDETEVQRHYEMMHDRHQKVVDDFLSSGGTQVGTIYRRKRRNKTYAEVRFDGIAGCLRTPRGGSAKQIVIHIDKGTLRIRWMSPREYARLQGADDFPLVGTRNQQLFGFGDAVCVPVIRWIDEKVLTPIYESVYAPATPNAAPHG